MLLWEHLQVQRKVLSLPAPSGWWARRDRLGGGRREMEAATADAGAAGGPQARRSERKVENGGNTCEYEKPAQRKPFRRPGQKGTRGQRETPERHPEEGWRR